MTGPSLVDEIERLGAAAEAGDMSAEQAAQLLQQFSDGGLTLIGARSAIDNWRTRRAEYRQSFDRTTALLRDLRGRCS